MAVLLPPKLLRTAAALAALAVLSGCATRYDSNGNRIYFLQFGQDTYNAIDYSNPRLPLLPRSRPPENLWQLPDPYEFNDLSRWSSITPDVSVNGHIAVNGHASSVGDNAACVASCESTAPGALLVSRADARVGSLPPERR